jgi:Transglycosylase SLT domain
MKTRLLTIPLAVGTIAAAIFTGLTMPAAAQPQTVQVRLPSGEIITLTVEVPPGSTLEDVQLPGELVSAAPAQPQPETAPTPEQAPLVGGGIPQERTGSGEPVPRERRKARELTGGVEAEPEADRSNDRRGRSLRLRNRDGSPTPANPGFVDALPGPSSAQGVPNFIIRKFRVPPFLLSIYQAAGIEYGVRWEVLAAINEIESDYGRNLNVSSAGAVGWMQFLPSTWRAYGVDANEDGRKDPYNPVDAIFAAARYLAAAGYEEDVRRAIFAYNHADWYVDSVLLRARLIAGVPADLIGSLTGLTEGRFPVYARARYADDVAERELVKRVAQGENAANLIESRDDRRSVDIYSRPDAPVVAVNDGVIKKVGRNRRLGRYLVLQDVYGNRFVYAHLGSVARFYPVPKADLHSLRRTTRSVKAVDPGDPAPSAPASAGSQLDDSDGEQNPPSGGASQASLPVKQRLFAHPSLPAARRAGGLEQLLERRARRGGGFETYRHYFSRPFGLDPRRVRLRRLKRGARVIGGTILGRVGRTVAGRAAHLEFAIRPAGRGAPRIDPKPILDGWKLLEATAIYRAAGRNVLYGERAGAASIGQVLLLSKPQLERRVLADERIELYACGRADVRSGQIDRRVLATLAYLAESGLRPTVSSLKCGHSFYTSSGSVSHHSSGNAVDIAKLNGIPVLGHQEPGGIVEQAVRRLMRLQGTVAPAQIISLHELGGATFAMADHHDHIHVGFSPRTRLIFRPGQWSNLLERLRRIDNPVVPVKPSQFALPTGSGD